MPDLRYEEAALQRGFRVIAGVDEVGRGPLAGPVTAAAVILGEAYPADLADSKTLSKRKRETLAPAIRAQCATGIGHASVEEINALNILQATYLAMRRAVANLPITPDYLLIDGNRLPPDLPCQAETIVKGDSHSASIAAASIVAKVCRDEIMVDLAQQFPAYDWHKNAGYPTQAHVNALKIHGITPHHRRSFAPIRNMLYQEK